MFSKISFAPCAAMPSVGAPPLFDLVGPTQRRRLSKGALQLAKFYDGFEEGRAANRPKKKTPLSQELQGEFAKVVITIAGQVGARGTLEAVVAILCPSLSLSAREPSSSARGSPAVRNAGNLPPRVSRPQRRSRSRFRGLNTFEERGS
jgi:hypothetical protein